MTELEYLESINYALTQIDSAITAQTDDFLGVVASNAAIVLSLFALCGCLIGFFAGLELLKIWNS